MATYTNPCDNTTGQTPIVGTSLPTVSSGTYSNSTPSTSRTATILHGVTITDKAQIKLTGYGSGTTGQAYVALLNVDPTDGDPLYGFALNVTATQVRIIQFNTAVSSSTVASASRTVTGANYADYRLEISDNGSSWTMRVYENDALLIDTTDTSYDISELTRVAAILQLGGSGGNSITEYSVSNELDSEAAAEPITLEFDFDGTNGSLPSGWTDFSGASSDASIQSNELSLESASGQSAVAILEVPDATPGVDITEWWIEATVEFVNNNNHWFNLILLSNDTGEEEVSLIFQPTNDKVFLAYFDGDDWVTDIGEDDASLPGLGSGMTVHIKAHYVYDETGSNGGLIEAWVWEDGDPEPETPTTSYSGTSDLNTTEAPLWGVYCYNGGGGTLTHDVQRYYWSNEGFSDDEEPAGSKLYIGDNQVTAMYLGDQEILAAYLGDVQVFG